MKPVSPNAGSTATWFKRTDASAAVSTDSPASPALVMTRTRRSPSTRNSRPSTVAASEETGAFSRAIVRPVTHSVNSGSQQIADVAVRLIDVSSESRFRRDVVVELGRHNDDQ